MKKINKYESLVGNWVVPISKDCDSKKELESLKSLLNVETRYALMKNKKWILVRRLTEEDLKSLDFTKYVFTFNYKSIKRLYK